MAREKRDRVAKKLFSKTSFFKNFLECLRVPNDAKTIIISALQASKNEKLREQMNEQKGLKSNNGKVQTHLIGSHSPGVPAGL